MPAQHPFLQEVLELDELWSFVQRRSNKRWVWLALCRRTRQVLAYAIGPRDDATCGLLWSRIPARYRCGRLYTDFWDSYANELPVCQHWPVDNRWTKRKEKPITSNASISRCASA